MRAYPRDCSEASFHLFRRWFGERYARATKATTWTSDGAVGNGTIEIARQWSVGVTIVNTLVPDSEPAWEAARGALEERLDREGLGLAIFVPRNARLPDGEVGGAEFVTAAKAATPAPGKRLELRRPAPLHLRRLAADGSIVTAIGGLSAHWARFTNRVSGTFQLNSTALFRMPADESERDDLFDRIVAAAGEANVDDGVEIFATDAWTAVDLEVDGSTILGTPQPENDGWRTSLRRNARRLLRAASERPSTGHSATALAVVGAATYSEDERLSWILKGIDPSHYAGYDIVTVIVDGTVKTVLEPPAGALPWDA